jgi:uncharacterized integral membrane protein
MRQLRWFVAVVLLLATLAAAVVFVIENSREVQVDLPLVRTFYQPLWLVIVAAFFLGAFAASAGLLFQLARKSLAVRRAEKRVRGLELEVQQLRAASSAIAVGDGAPPIQRAPS